MSEQPVSPPSADKTLQTILEIIRAPINVESSKSLEYDVTKEGGQITFTSQQKLPIGEAFHCVVAINNALHKNKIEKAHVCAKTVYLPADNAYTINISGSGVTTELAKYLQSCRHTVTQPLAVSAGPIVISAFSDSNPEVYLPKFTERKQLAPAAAFNPVEVIVQDEDEEENQSALWKTVNAWRSAKGFSLLDENIAYEELVKDYNTIIEEEYAENPGRNRAAERSRKNGNPRRRKFDALS